MEFEYFAQLCFKSQYIVHNIRFIIVHFFQKLRLWLFSFYHVQVKN